MDQEAEEMKNKKLLWPWAEKQVNGDAEISEWFHTFMCMNIPIYGWFYLKKLARQPEHNKIQDFARAYLYYKMVFLAVSLVIVILLLIIGIFSINKLFAYMELL